MKQKCAVVGTVNKVNQEKYVVVYESETLPLENGSRIPDIDILFTNISLQTFSTASKEKGDVITPFDAIMTVVKEKKPKTVVLENVSGLLLYQEGRTFKRMCEVMNDAGYKVSKGNDTQSGLFYVRAERM